RDSTSQTRRQLLLGLALVSSAWPFISLAKAPPVRRVFITGSTDGLGRGAAVALMREGHEVILHARSKERAAQAFAALAPRAAGVVIGDLANAAQTRALADQVNEIGRVDAVIHNAGIFREPNRGTTPEGHAKVLAVNTLAPYMLTALIERPERLIYIGSSMHHGGDDSLHDIDWVERRWDTYRAYSERILGRAAESPRRADRLLVQGSEVRRCRDDARRAERHARSARANRGGRCAVPRLLAQLARQVGESCVQVSCRAEHGRNRHLDFRSWRDRRPADWHVEDASELRAQSSVLPRCEGQRRHARAGPLES